MSDTPNWDDKCMETMPVEMGYEHCPKHHETYPSAYPECLACLREETQSDEHPVRRSVVFAGQPKPTRLFFGVPVYEPIQVEHANFDVWLEANGIEGTESVKITGIVHAWLEQYAADDWPVTECLAELEQK